MQANDDTLSTLHGHDSVSMFSERTHSESYVSARETMATDTSPSMHSHRSSVSVLHSHDVHALYNGMQTVSKGSLMQRWRRKKPAKENREDSHSQTPLMTPKADAKKTGFRVPFKQKN